MKKFLREPLVHFILGGTLLWFISTLVSDKSFEGEYDITVNDRSIVQYFQFREKSFDAGSATKKLAEMSPQERAELENDYIRDEILYREAIKLGMDANDSVIRSRLIQKMDYIILGIKNPSQNASESELRAYFDKYSTEYRVSPSISFTHVFINNKDRGTEEASILAKTVLHELRLKNISFDEASQYGEKFYYHRDYQGRSAEFIKSHFGNDMMYDLFGTSVDIGLWQGPFTSEYGAHLVLIKSRTASRLPTLEEVAPQVLADLDRLKRSEMRADAVEKLKHKYRIIR